MDLIKRKPYFENEIGRNELGSPPLSELLCHLKPRHWFSGHLHVKFSASINWNEGHSTEFLALDKTLPNRPFMEIVNIPSLKDCSDYKISIDQEWIAILRQKNVNFLRSSLVLPEWTGSSEKMSDAVNKLIYGNPEELDIND